VLEHEVSFEADHPVAEASESAIPACVSRAAESVVAPVNLHDKPRSWSDEVYDEAADNLLTPERHAETATADEAPEQPRLA
jgi:hypothetical protein